MSLRIHLLVSDVNQGNEECDCKKVVQDLFAWPQGWKDSPYIFREQFKKCALEVGWNSGCVEFVIAG